MKKIFDMTSTSIEQSVSYAKKLVDELEPLNFEGIILHIKTIFGVQFYSCEFCPENKMVFVKGGEIKGICDLS